jgi:hypothetical protein
MIDPQIEIPTRNGHVATFISHPERGGFAFPMRPADHKAAVERPGERLPALHRRNLSS